LQQSPQNDTKEHKLTNEIHEKYQKQLDEFVSTPENKKYFQMLELEIDVLRHNGEKIPNIIRPKEWMIILKFPSKSQRM